MGPLLTGLIYLLKRIVNIRLLLSTPTALNRLLKEGKIVDLAGREEVFVGCTGTADVQFAVFVTICVGCVLVALEGDEALDAAHL